MESPQTETSIDVQKKEAYDKAMEHYADLLRGAEKEQTYDYLRHVFRVALCNTDYDGQHHINSLVRVFDLMDTILYAINPELKPTVYQRD